MAGPKHRLQLNGVSDEIIGRSADQAGRVHAVSGIRVALVKGASMPDGYRILTAFPRP
jgi:hypothetical protein